MASSMRWMIVAVGALAACSGSSETSGQATRPPAVNEPATAEGPSPSPAPAKAAHKLDAEEKLVLPSGATFTGSAGWTVDARPDRVALVSPEKDLTMVYVEVKAADRAAAIAAAWKIWQPDFNLVAAQQQDLPARDGWDAIGQTLYVTPAAELRFVGAVARRKGPTWYVLLLDGKQAGLDRRGAQIGTAIESLKVPGLDKESFAGETAHPLDAAKLGELAAFIEEARTAAKVPGAAIAIVQGGKIVYEKGFGVRELGKKDKVGPRTLFMIGSVGKSLTTLMMARLVEQGRFAWDTPVVQVLPTFGLGDDATTKQATMRHTACACTGMPRQDLEMIFEGKATPEDRLASMKTMKPTTGFGETFQYSNLMVSAGGFAAAHAYAPKAKLGAAYDDAMQALVFKPLGMTSTTLDFKKVARAEHAAPHPRDLHGEPVAVPIAAEEWVLPVRPAGGAWSSVHDMARVLQLELARGKLDGKQLVAEEQLLARRKPQIKINDEFSYGLGLGVGTQHEIAVVSHTGGTGGFNTLFAFLPDHDVGYVIVANATGSGFFNQAVERRLWELLFDGKPQAKEDLTTALAIMEKQRSEELALIQADPDPAWFGPLVGKWTAPGLGQIELRVDKGKAVLDAGEWKVPVGKKTDRDGTVKLLTTGGIVPGLELIPREQEGRTVLVLDDSQRSYVFERASKP